MGDHVSFEGYTCYIIAGCAMTTFSCMEPVKKANDVVFAAAFMKIQLRFGFCLTLVLDKDSKLYSTFRETSNLLTMNTHTLGGENHNPTIVKRTNRYLNKSMKIFCQERGTVKVAAEGILMALCAWNSVPIPGTDLSRSLVLLGREFYFPIDLSAQNISN